MGLKRSHIALFVGLSSGIISFELKLQVGKGKAGEVENSFGINESIRKRGEGLLEETKFGDALTGVSKNLLEILLQDNVRRCVIIN